MICTMARESQRGFVAMDRRRHRHEAGFTLIELLTVVAIVAVLAVLAVLSYRRFIKSSHVSEAQYMAGSIRSAEESYRAETMAYLNVSSNWGLYYPNSAPDDSKWNWDNPAHTDYAAWRQLGARADGPVRFGYTVQAGTAGQNPKAAHTKVTFQFPTPTTEPWYVIEAADDSDKNGTYCYVVTSSFSGEVYVENEGE
jgi:prepilin-type N-terminal cleavage/methylation domain-containing protein